jgi:adenosylhomocysteinase
VLGHSGGLEPRVYDVPEEIDTEVARLKLQSLGVSIDTLTAEQNAYAADWRSGT